MVLCSKTQRRLSLMKPSSRHVELPVASLHCQLPSAQQVAPSKQIGLPNCPGSSNGSQQAGWQTSPSSAQVDCPAPLLHCQVPSEQQLEPSMHPVGWSAGSQQASQAIPSTLQVELAPASLHCHSPLAQQVAPSKQVGLPKTPGSSLGSQQDLLTATRGDVARNAIAMYKALGGGWELRAGKSFVPDEMSEQMRQRTDWGGLLDPAATEVPPPAEAAEQLRSPDW